MQIINVTLDLFLNSRSFLFEDDTEVTVDTLTNEVRDCDGLTHCDETRQKAIEKHLGKSITV